MCEDRTYFNTRDANRNELRALHPKSVKTAHLLFYYLIAHFDEMFSKLGALTKTAQLPKVSIN